jgi:lipoprotein-releasing system permease protein
MKFPFFIAYRYFQPSTKKNLIHRIGLISFISIAVSTTALLLVLSVFNGLEDFIRSLFRSFDPDIKITLKEGKTFALNLDLKQKICAVQGVAKVVEVLEDNALLRYQGRQAIVKLKGVSEEFLEQSSLKPFLIRGNWRLKQGTEHLAILGCGVQYALAVSLTNLREALQAFYPRNVKNSAALPQQLYRCAHIRPGAVFSVEKQLDDNYVIVPINFAASLMGKRNQRTALEIQLVNNFPIKQVQQTLRLLVPTYFQVLNSQEQRATLMKAIHIERLFVLMTFTFILLVASLNTFFILSMLVLDKRKDIAILYVLGATPKDIRCILLIEGLLIALSGVTVGIALAWGLTWLQQTFGLISLGAQTSLLEAYPIKRKMSDFIYTTVGVVLMTLVASYRPAQLASSVKVDEHL